MHMTLAEAEGGSGIPRERRRPAIRAGRLVAVKDVHPDAGDGWTPLMSQAWLVDDADLRQYLRNRGRQVRPDRREMLRVVEQTENLIRRALREAELHAGLLGTPLLTE